MMQQSEEKNKISSSEVTSNFYRTVQSKLNIILLALNVIKSNLVEQKDTKSTGEAVSGVQAAATIVRSTMSFVRAQKRKKHRKNMSQIGVSIYPNGENYGKR